jgi:HAD domain in Swiss Army Knife RNA repair proteins
MPHQFTPFLARRRSGAQTAAGDDAMDSHGRTARRVVLIFLDIDGVLLPFPLSESAKQDLRTSSVIFPKENLEALNYLMKSIRALATTTTGAFPSDNDKSRQYHEESSTGRNPDPEIVLSSTWRVQDAFRQEILDSFQRSSFDHLSRMTDFYAITDIHLHTTRQHEIHSWIQKHLVQNPTNPRQLINRGCSNIRDGYYNDLVAAWIVIDDEEILEGVSNRIYRKTFENGHVIKTDSNVGFTMQLAEKALRLIREQLNRTQKE